MELLIALGVVLLAVLAILAFVTIQESKKYALGAAAARAAGKAYTQDTPAMAVDYSGDTITYGNPNGSAFGNFVWKIIGPVIEPPIHAIFGRNKR